MKFWTAQCSQPGARPYNEDRVFCGRTDQGLLALVVGGLGGYGGGADAAQAAVDSCWRDFQAAPGTGREALQQLAQRANEEVRRLQRSGGQMKSTLVALAADQGMWAVVHVGDSRCYHFRDGQLLSRTIDHSVSQMEALAGRITDREIRFHADRNKVLRALGGGEEVRPEVRPAEPLQPGDCFLLCSDGFWEYVWEEEMLADLVKSRTPEDWLRYMAGRIGKRLNPHSDNFSAVALFCCGRGFLP